MINNGEQLRVTDELLTGRNSQCVFFNSKTKLDITNTLAWSEHGTI